jgi:hypothetical protein
MLDGEGERELEGLEDLGERLQQLGDDPCQPEQLAGENEAPLEPGRHAREAGE